MFEVYVFLSFHLFSFFSQFCTVSNLVNACKMCSMYMANDAVGLTNLAKMVLYVRFKLLRHT